MSRASGTSSSTSTSPGRTTLKDIARIAGVSVSTASLVLAGKAEERRISREVVRRVRQVATEQDYAPNLLVRSMQKGRTHILSLYSAFGSRQNNDLYMDRLSTALERVAGQLGYDVLVHCDYTRPIDETYRMLNGGRSDGLVFFGPQQDDPLLPLLRGSRLPTVVLNHIDEADQLSSVSEDMQQGMRLIAAELVRLGHRRIAAIASFPGRRSDAPIRIETLQALLAESGIELSESWVIPVFDEGPYNPAAALRLLMSDPEPPTAIFCWNDRAGYEILEACEEQGISVPDQLSLIGYDGLHWPSTSKHILSSVDVHLDRLAEAAAHLLHDLIDGKQSSPVVQMFPVSLISGTTLAAPAQKI